MLISSLANLERLITEKLKVSESDLKSLLLINRLIAELLDRCNGEVALEARDRLCASHLEQLCRLIEHIRERVVERLEVLVNSFELRADDVPVEIVQLDVANADVGNVDVESLIEFRQICVFHNSESPFIVLWSRYLCICFISHYMDYYILEKLTCQ